MAACQPLLSVTGTHGKTTTSSMLAVALKATGPPISWLIGAPVPSLGSSAEYNEGPWMVLEADESDGSFMAGPREGAVVTNLEADHLEYWGDWDSLRRAFAEFVDGTDGPVVICADDPGSAVLAEARRDGGANVTYGTGDVDYAVADLRVSGRWSLFDLVAPSGRYPVRLLLPGRHNALNAAGALALVSELGLDLSSAIEGLTTHTGVQRRFERRGSAGGVEVVDDYAHLPSEVVAALEAGSASTEGRLVVVFQPHRYSRTQALWAEFAESFDAADVLVLTDIYPAGETAREGVSGKLIHDAVAARSRVLGSSPTPLWAPTLEEVAAMLDEVLVEGDLLMTVGAGDVRDVGDMVLAARGALVQGDGTP
jgi:UDP-N-acetylmuramate--alanine ligase